MIKVFDRDKKISNIEEQMFLGKFPNNEIYPKNDFHYITKDEFIVYWLFQEDKLYEDLFKLEMFKGFGKTKTLIIGYLPYSRSDKPLERPIFMLKFISEKINNIGFDNVKICEPHSDMSLAFVNSIDQINVTSAIYNTVIKNGTRNKIENFALVYPDLGAMKRYSKQITHDKTICCLKERDVDGKIVSFNLLNPKNIDLMFGHFIIVDDLCSRGGTFLEILDKISEFKPIKVDLIVAHLEENVFSGDLISHHYLSNIYTSNAILRKGYDNKIKEIVDITNFFQ